MAELKVKPDTKKLIKKYRLLFDRLKEELREVQSQPGNSDQGEYMRGLANGRILAAGIMKDEEPVYLEFSENDKPKRTETRVKRKADMMAALAENGYEPDNGMTFSNLKTSGQSFSPLMWERCGGSNLSYWAWEPWMLEEVEVKEKVPEAKGLPPFAENCQCYVNESGYIVTPEGCPCGLPAWRDGPGLSELEANMAQEFVADLKKKKPEPAEGKPEKFDWEKAASFLAGEPSSCPKLSAFTRAWAQVIRAL